MPDAKKLAEIVSKLFQQCLEHETWQTRQYDVFLAEGRCLRILNENNKLSVHQLAEKMSLTSSRITRIIDSLVIKNLVTRESNLADRRVYFLSMTPRGQQLTHAMQNDYIQFYQLILNQIPETQRLLFINMLQEFYQIMTNVNLFK